MIDKVLKQYNEIDKEIKDLTKQKEELRSYINRVSNDRGEANLYNRDTKHIHFPKTMLDTKEKVIKHIEDNLFTWDLMDVSEEDDGFSTFLRKKAEFSAFEHQTKDFVLRRDITNTTPRVDWDSLEKENPDIVKQISTEITTRIIDESEFKKRLNSDPEFISTLERHIIEVTPSTRISVKPVKK